MPRLPSFNFLEEFARQLETKKNGVPSLPNAPPVTPTKEYDLEMMADLLKLVCKASTIESILEDLKDKQICK